MYDVILKIIIMSMLIIAQPIALALFFSKVDNDINDKLEIRLSTIVLYCIIAISYIAAATVLK